MQLFLLQSPLRRIFAAVFMICLLVVSACKNDDDGDLAPVTVNFPANGSITLGESADAKTINLTLSGPAVKDGTISISGTGATDVLGFDATISVTKGNTVAILHIDPTNNDKIDGNRDVTLTISSVTDGFIIGTPATYKVSVVDDEGPTTVFFENSEATVSEASANALEVTISLSAKATAAGTFTITLDPADAPVTTTPEAVNGVITIPVAVGDESVKFSVMPVNNDEDSGDAIVTFTLGETETVKITEDNALTLTITDDDAIVPTTIAAVRAMYNSSDVPITTDIYIKGIVTSQSAADGNVAPTGLYLQDASGAMPVFFTAVHGAPRGKEVLINLNGSTLTSFQNLFEATSAPVANITVLGDGTLPTARLITMADLNAGTYESQLVKLDEVSFIDADGLVKMGGSKILTDGTNNGTVFTRTGATFQNDLVPLGKGTVTGIASDFTTGPQLLPQVFATDVFANNPVGTIALSPVNALDFGSVAKNAKSTEQIYTVTGTTLAHPITVTASTGYQVSLTDTDGDFSTSVELSEGGGTIHIRFAPTSGVDGLNKGSITHKSQGAATVALEVNGTETGNSSTVKYTEAFEYTAGAKLTDNLWTVSSGGGTNALTVGNGNGLTYAGYPLAGGNGLAMTTSGEDDYKVFANEIPATAGTVYMAFVVKFTAAQAAGDYFIGLSATGAQTNYYARVFAKSSGTGFNLGMRKNAETSAVSYGTTELTFGTTYLIVVKYTFNPNDKDDTVSLYVNPASSAEPTSGEVYNYIDTNVDPALVKNDIANFAMVTLRQGTASSAPTLVIDGLRIATAYADLFN
jgi:hypothetical protein